MRTTTRRTLLRSTSAAAALAALPSMTARPALGAPAPKGGRGLGIAVIPAQDGDYDTAFRSALEVGMNRLPLAFIWDALEREPGVYDMQFPDVANLFMPSQGIGIDLVLAPIATTRRTVPADLAGRDWDDPELIDRLKAWAGAVVERMPDVDLRSIVIGQEVDGVLGVDESAWRAYETLFAETADHVRSLRPGVPIGVQGMLDGRLGYAADYFPLVDQHADMIAVSHYWLDEAFVVRDVDVIPGVFDRLTRSYPDSPIYMVECGYPSSRTNGSSPAAQADWVRAIFAAWDDHADRIPLLAFVWQHDISAEEVAAYEAYYGLEGEAFAAYLGSIGLRTHEGGGEDKPAWLALAEEAAARGW